MISCCRSTLRRNMFHFYTSWPTFVPSLEVSPHNCFPFFFPLFLLFLNLISKKKSTVYGITCIITLLRDDCKIYGFYHQTTWSLLALKYSWSTNKTTHLPPIYYIPQTISWKQVFFYFILSGQMTLHLKCHIGHSFF